MNKVQKRLVKAVGLNDPALTQQISKLIRSVVEETLEQVSERTYGRGENQWYYDDDERWIRLHFGYGELMDEVRKR